VISSDLTPRFDDLAARLLEARDEMVDVHMGRALESSPEFFVLPEPVVDAGRRFCRESFRIESEHLRRGMSLPEACPEVDLEYARFAAQLGFPVAEVVRTYHRGHEVQWETWQLLVERADLGADERSACLHAGSRFFFAYADRLASWTFAAYAETRDGLLQSSAQRRTNLVRDVLEDRPVDTAPFGYDLNTRHVGVVAWGAGAQRAVHALATTIGRRALVIEATQGVWWGWLGGTAPLRDRLAAAPAGEVRLAVGRDAHGVEGFRRTHEQAVHAHRAAQSGDAPVTSFDDVALEALLARDPSAAWSFVHDELGALADDGDRAAVLRATLRAWFATGHNASAAAARLGVHEQTVTARLRTVEERLGRPPQARRAELEAALRLLVFLPHDIRR